MHLTAKRPMVSDKGGEIPVSLNLLIRQMMSKDRDDRPRDALQVGEELKQLARRARKGEAIEMVFAGGAPARLGGPVDSVSPTKAESSTSKVSGSVAESVNETTPSTPSGLTAAARSQKTRKTERRRVIPTDPAERFELFKTIGLVVLLLITAALIAYVVWPPSAKTLYSKAETLMASKNASDWRQADREFLSELDRRFPNLYLEQKQSWRDQIALEEAKRRAAILEKPNLGRLSEPKSGAETTYVTVFNEASGAIKDGRDEEAVQKWRDMADVLLNSSDPLDRPWGRLAEVRAQETLDGMEKRRKTVETMLDRADVLQLEAKYEEAIRLREDVVRRFGSIRSLKELIQRRAKLEPKDKPESNEKEPESKEKNESTAK